MSISDLSSPSPAEVENLVVLFVGFALATFLYGLTFFREYLTPSHWWCGNFRFPAGARNFERLKARTRLWLYICTRDVLGAAMRLLSIRPLERM
ncbi:hypothetical protein DEU56DRAFT_803535 [Suillus clintonianus]|uniref:uncharacterized protein n=1 Tax=Suillus clintonianus TaxID=1904413 RepID=UPI001B8868AC|nr:uncharacterized protein DEU56DRAFT_803535 [Suillus clintonianus]KAG2137989.1 hypothetical protein DEU56DRAFT_803535 [Suillus clintonianus]